MADERRDRRPARDGAREGARRPGTSRDAGRSSGRPTGRGEGAERGGRGRDGGRDAGGSRGGRPDARGGRGRDAGGRDAGPRRDPATRSADQAAYDGPELPAEITGRELDRTIAHQLKSLPEKLANRVARHLAAATAMIDDDPETAYQHARAAEVRAPRLAVVREAAGEAAYAAGHYAEALADLRAAKRMNGATAYLPIMADCHRALGHPEQALKLSKSPSVAGFALGGQGGDDARGGRGASRHGSARRRAAHARARAAAVEVARAWVVRLRYAYADTLAEAGRTQDAVAWFHRTDAIDADELTDAAERAEALEKTLEG